MSTALHLNVETIDGAEYEVTAVFADLIKYDVLRARLNFPPRDQSEFLFMGLVAFCALLRTGKIPNESKPEDFLNTIAGIEPTEEDEAEFPAESAE